MDPQRYISGQQFAGEYQERGEIIVMHNLWIRRVYQETGVRSTALSTGTMAVWMLSRGSTALTAWQTSYYDLLFQALKWHNRQEMIVLCSSINHKLGL